jgi:hypothetical protein
MSLKEEPLFGVKGNEASDDLMNFFDFSPPQSVQQESKVEQQNIDIDVDDMVSNSLSMKTSPVTRTSPTVLGSDPINVAKNMDIARRTA